MKTNNHKKAERKFPELNFLLFSSLLFDSDPPQHLTESEKGFLSLFFHPFTSYLMKFTEKMCFLCSTHLSLHNCSGVTELNWL